MPFNSPIFLFLFLPVFMLVYFLAGQRARLVVGIAGSLLFYAWGDLPHVALLIGLTLVAYLLGRGIDHWRGRPAGTAVFWAGIGLNVGLLAIYKLFSAAVYPLGLSYVTFQVIAYLIETRRSLTPVETDLLKFSFYLLLFPKIPVGPIVRYSHVRSQIADLRTDPTSVADGLRRCIRGLAKKVLIADTLAKTINPAFALASPAVSPPVAWLILIGYAVQLYFDFSGYADMAIGMSRMMGLRILENFNFPYLAGSIGEFWRRWHISLASWFRDFVFYPLERHRIRYVGQAVNTIIVFALVGLWHGVTRSMLVWGLIHGAALVAESTPLGRKVTALPAPLRNAYALTVILFGWVFFRSPTLGFAYQFLLRLLGNTHGVRPLPFHLTSPLPIIEPTFILALVAGVIFSLPVGLWSRQLLNRLLPASPAVQLSQHLLYDCAMLGLLLTSIAAIASSTFAPAIYGSF
jgi:alginate O-acetyltransferase complex protein AlgI